MSISKALLALALGAALVACAPRPPIAPVSDTDQMTNPAINGLENRVERFTKPDKFGIVCYQYLHSSNNLSCVKVENPDVVVTP